MKFFSSVFAVSLLVASALTIDAGTTTQVSDNCDTGFSQTGERSSTYGKQGVPIAKSGFSLAGSSNTGQNNNDQSNPDQNNPDQNNPGQNTPDQNATSSDGSQEQTTPVLKGYLYLRANAVGWPTRQVAGEQPHRHWSRHA
ncbi:hypothetical protein PC119_g17622 [Phytophthora cactorum]|nr:hypothetical protein PC119_g17622 [Phytophthora cactorum]